MNKKYAYAFAALMLGLTACSNEDLTAPAENQVAGKTVHVTLTVNRPSDNTRTVVDENPDGRSLYSHWVSGDKLLVVNSGNVNVGELEIESIDSDDASKAVFSGNATLNTTDKYTLVYLGGSNDNRGAYATWTNGTGISNPVATPDSETGFTVSGDLADLCRADLMKKDDVQFLISGENAYPTENVTLGAVNAMAHFTLTGIPGVLDNEAVLTVNYGDVTHKISNITSELYLPMPTGSYILSFSLVNGNDSYTASINDGNSVTVTPLYYVDTDIATGNGKGIPVELAKVEDPDQGPTDDDLVGPEIPIGNKKYRFVKGNLYCDILDKNNYVWHLYERETDYQLKAGTSSYYDNGKGYVSYVRQINGTWKGSSNPSNVNENNRYIDLFPWGATGLGTGDYKAKLPDIIRKGIADENTGTSYTGAYWPSDVTNTMDVNGNANIINLWQNYSFMDPIYDFGYAYMQNGRPAGDTRTYVTAPLEAYKYICENSFSQGCVVKGANYDGTSDAKGALILYGITDIEDAKAAIKEVGGSVKSGFAALDPNKPKSGFTYLIELPNYESLQKLNEVKEVNGKTVSIQAMFFASGGNGVYIFNNSKKDSYVNTNDTDGAYWTCNGEKGSSTNANAYGFYFRNASTATEFCWKSDASGVSSKRNTQRSVRLMVEVTESDSGTTGPEFSN